MIFEKLDHLENLKPFGGKEYTGYECKSNEVKSPEGSVIQLRGPLDVSVNLGERQQDMWG